MVFLGRILSKEFNGKLIQYQDRKRRRTYLDTMKLLVCGGAGGMGLPRYGGIGGAGGNVILKATKEAELINLVVEYKNKIIKAATGGNSRSHCILGQKGEDKVVSVPLGIRVINSFNQIIGELDKEGHTLIVAKGGPGGCEETGWSGLKGQVQHVCLDLKLIADIGFVGFPNAGKSTLLKAITKAKPKIASYPFTTVKPNIGIMEYKDKRSISLADLPGLIEGAHRNYGMGHKFLRHLERTKLLLFVVDINGFQLNERYDRRSCLETVILLNKELEMYREFLVEKPAMLVVNKMDCDGAWETFEKIEPLVKNLQDTIWDFPSEMRPERPIKFDIIVPISAKTDQNSVQCLKETIRDYLDTYSDQGHVDDIDINEKFLRKSKEFGPAYT